MNKKLHFYFKLAERKRFDLLLSFTPSIYSCSLKVKKSHIHNQIQIHRKNKKHFPLSPCQPIPFVSGKAVKTFLNFSIFF